ncbi:hypothetical protein ACFSSA_09455 [Luteolibacter algae]|uniref:Outer membrane lipoprotein-sorting protein n=1 Tax=Luteolibacter algae TaxID=454151 RepID=A0ABW5D827_9BACT
MTDSESTDEARELVMESIEAHGGKDKWYENGLLHFRWQYHMSDKGPEAILDTVQTVDPASLDVVHEVVGSDVRFGMSGGEVWIQPEDGEFASPPRFWSLTPFYFIGIPFVFNDESANFELLDDKLEFEGKDYTQVKITYDKDAGDSPDDYYVLLIDPDTKLTKGAHYTVTNKLVAPNGPGPAKFITLDDFADIDGVKLAGGHRTFKMTDDGKIGEQMRFTNVSDVKFLPRGSVDLSMPK